MVEGTSLASKSQTPMTQEQNVPSITSPRP
jgi:hypothetical protein